MANRVSKRSRILFGIIKVTARFAFYPFFKIQVAGLENIPEKGPFILLPKHERWEDIPILGMSVKRSLYYIAKHELFKNYISRCFISLLGGLPLDRQYPSKSRDSLELMITLLRKGEGVVIYPEGTYCRGKMGAGHFGLIKMVYSRFEIPFIPVGINYSKKGWRSHVRILIGTPVSADQANDSSRVCEDIMTEIARLSGL